MAREMERLENERSEIDMQEILPGLLSMRSAFPAQ